MQLSNEQYNELRALASKLDSILDELKGMEPNEETQAYWAKRMGVLAEVLNVGGVVSDEEWAKIGKLHGYDTRGLGGFFVGEKASMVKIGNNKRAITEFGTRETLSWLNGRYGAKPTEEQINKYKKLTQ